MTHKMQKFTALILDDEECIVEEVAEAIILLGGEVDAFSNAAECIDFLKGKRRSYDVVIVDLAMPYLNGLEFLELASQHFVNSPERILMTGLAEVDGRPVEESMSITLLQKPIGFHALKKIVGRP